MPCMVNRILTKNHLSTLFGVCFGANQKHCEHIFFRSDQERLFRNRASDERSVAVS
jgi:hypothetical protein